MALYDGTTMRIKIGTKVLFHETNAKLNSTIPFKEVASKDTAGTLSTPGTQSWSISCSSLIANGDGSTQEDLATLYASHKAKTLVSIEFSTDVSGDVVFAGSAYIENYNVDSSNDEEVKGDFSFKGDGELTIAVVA